MSEPQYDACYDEPPVFLGPMTGATFRWNPMRLGWYLARYKFVAKMLQGKGVVAEIGCADAFASAVVASVVGELDVYDFDDRLLKAAHEIPDRRFSVKKHDILTAPLPWVFPYGAIYMCDVIEHIRPLDEPRLMSNILASLHPNSGVFLAGAPSLESQAYATTISKAGHVNCRSGEQFRADMQKYFENVFMFSMNDEVVHTGDFRMAHYLFALCTGPR